MRMSLSRDWAAFFSEYGEFANSDLAAIAGCSVSTIRNKKRLLGISLSEALFTRPYKEERRANQYESVEDPAIWDNEEWFRQKYEVEKLGKQTIARIINRPRTIVVRRLRKYNIFSTVKQPVHPCCTEEWLIYHYCVREDYVDWCEERNKIPEEGGGMGLPLRGCAAIADVCKYTIYNWLAKFGIYIREKREALSLTQYHFHYDESSVEARKTEDKKLPR